MKTHLMKQVMTHHHSKIPNDSEVANFMVAMSAMATLADTLPKCRNNAFFTERKEYKNWLDNTLRFCNLMTRRIEKSISESGDHDADAQMYSHMHHFQKLLGMVARADASDMIMISEQLKEFMETEYEIDVDQSIFG